MYKWVKSHIYIYVFAWILFPAGSDPGIYMREGY